MSPNLRPRKGGQIGAGRDEPEGVGQSGGAGPGAQPATAGGGWGDADGPELPAGQAAVEAVSGGRRRGAEAPQRGTSLKSCARGEVSAEGAAAGAGEVRGVGGRAFRADAGGRALGLGGWAVGECRNAAAVDAGRGVVEPRAQAAAAPATAPAQGAFWRAGADGRQLSPLARGARPAGLLDRHGR